MSDAPQQAGPDLHAIFGIDEAADAGSDPVVEVERTVATDDDMTVEGGVSIAEDAVLDDDGVVIELDHAPEPALEPESEDARTGAVPREGEWTGITRPSRRGSSSDRKSTRLNSSHS